ASANSERSVRDYLEDDSLMQLDLTAAAAAKLEDLIGLNFTEIRGKIGETKKPVPASIKASFQVDVRPEILERQTTQNVVAFLEGSDPKLKEEIVLLSAHYDHVGMAPAPPPGNATNKDRIFNGADDDGSGTVGILNLAEAYA